MELIKEDPVYVLALIFDENSQNIATIDNHAFVMVKFEYSKEVPAKTILLTPTFLFEADFAKKLAAGLKTLSDQANLILMDPDIES